MKEIKKAKYGKKGNWNKNIFEYHSVNWNRKQIDEKLKFKRFENVSLVCSKRDIHYKFNFRREKVVGWGRKEKGRKNSSEERGRERERGERKKKER